MLVSRLIGYNVLLIVLHRRLNYVRWPISPVTIQ